MRPAPSLDLFLVCQPALFAGRVPCLNSSAHPHYNIRIKYYLPSLHGSMYLYRRFYTLHGMGKRSIKANASIHLIVNEWLHICLQSANPKFWLSLSLSHHTRLHESPTSIIESQRLSPGRSPLRLLLGVATPDWCAFVKNNVTIILHSADDSAAASIRVGGPNGVVVNVAIQPYQPQRGSLNKTQHTIRIWKKGIYRKQTYYMHRLPSVCIWMPLMSLRCSAVFWKWHTPPQYTVILPSLCILNSTEPSWLNRLLSTCSHSSLPRVLCVIFNKGLGV